MLNPVDSALHTVLEFALGDDRFALPANDVIEVVRAVAITPLPGAPAAVAGAIDFHGTLVPVFDLRPRFGYPARALDPGEHFIITRAGMRVVALRTDRALGVAQLQAEQIERLGGNVSGTRFVTRLAKTTEGLLLIHDPACFLSELENDVLEEALSGRTALS